MHRKVANTIEKDLNDRLRAMPTRASRLPTNSGHVLTRRAWTEHNPNAIGTRVMMIMGEDDLTVRIHALSPAGIERRERAKGHLLGLVYTRSVEGPPIQQAEVTGVNIGGTSSRIGPVLHLMEVDGSDAELAITVPDLADLVKRDGAEVQVGL